jgi:hypothetical protein
MTPTRQQTTLELSRSGAQNYWPTMVLAPWGPQWPLGSLRCRNTTKPRRSSSTPALVASDTLARSYSSPTGRRYPRICRLQGRSRAVRWLREWTNSREMAQVSPTADCAAAAIDALRRVGASVGVAYGTVEYPRYARTRRLASGLDIRAGTQPDPGVDSGCTMPQTYLRVGSLKGSMCLR